MFGIFKKLKQYVIEWCLQPTTTTLGALHGNNASQCEIYNGDQLKFIEQKKFNRFLVKTPTGYSRIVHSHKTVKYDVYQLTLENGLSLKCADEHIVMNGTTERYVKDLVVGEFIDTVKGPSKVSTIVKLDVPSEHMYDLELDDGKHVYYTNDIVSHNSVSSGVYLLWFAIFNPDATILIASNKNSNAMEMIKRIQYTYECLPHWMKPGVVDGGWNKHELGFDNGTRIISQATSENTGRGLAITLLFLDEFAFVRPSVQEEFWTSILPTLSTGGACIITSTPNGSTDKFSAIWRAATLNSNTDDLLFAHMHVKWDAPPGRDERFKRTQIKLLGQAKWDQEYECKFISTDPLLIDPIALATAEDNIKDPISTNNLGFEFYQPIKHGRTYLIGIDPSTGASQDFSVLICYDFTDLSIVAMLRNNTVNSPQLYAMCKWFFNYIVSQGANAYFTVENNGIGEGFIALYENDEKFPDGIDFITEADGNRLGFRTDGKSKLRACLTLKQLAESGRIDICEARFVKELKSYIASKGAYNAQVGATDDIISAALLVIRLLSEISIYEQRAFDVMNQFEELTSEGLSDNGHTIVEEYDQNYVPDGFVM